MVIRRHIYLVIIIGFFFISLAITVPIRNGQMNPENSIKEIQPTSEVKTSETLLIDKVYNFTTWRPWKMFKDILFQAELNYFIYFQIVTPHKCEITVTIFDPNGSKYDVYYDDNFNQDDDLVHFPFGAAITGLYDIRFDLDIDFNLNMYIKIEETIKCLYDVFNWQEIQNIRQYGVSKFENSLSLVKEIPLESDVAYTLYFARVTPFSDILPDFTVRYDYSLRDEDQSIPFIINWKDTPLAPINNVTRYSFGTAHGGRYQTNLTVTYDYNPVNIAYAIIYDHKISGEIDENDTFPDTDQESTQLFSIPTELAMVTMIGIGVLLFVVVGVAVTKRREFNSP